MIECKSPKTEVDQAVSQTIRNQRDEYIPTLYTYAQLVIGSNKNHCKYATVGTAAKWVSIFEPESSPMRVVARAGKTLLHAQVAITTRELLRGMP